MYTFFFFFFLSLSLSFLLSKANQKNRHRNFCKLSCVSLPIHTFVYGVPCFVMFFFSFFQTSRSFCHHLILKLERKGMEGWIANIRGFWKFPFYGTWVFKNSSLSVVFLWFGWQSVCPALPLAGPSLLKSSLHSMEDSEREDSLNCIAWKRMVRLVFFVFFKADKLIINLYSHDFQ
jgi:hypothetical protein